jgi:hypothetical protein
MHSSFYREPVKEICRAIFYRDLRTGNLQNLTWHFFFQRPPWMNTVGWGCCCLASLGPLMILGWFWVLSTFPFRNFGILTAHCLGSSRFTGIIMHQPNSTILTPVTTSATGTWMDWLTGHLLYLHIQIFAQIYVTRLHVHIHIFCAGEILSCFPIVFHHPTFTGSQRAVAVAVVPPVLCWPLAQRASMMWWRIAMHSGAMDLLG